MLVLVYCAVLVATEYLSFYQTVRALGYLVESERLRREVTMSLARIAIWGAPIWACVYGRHWGRAALTSLGFLPIVLIAALVFFSSIWEESLRGLLGPLIFVSVLLFSLPTIYIFGISSSVKTFVEERATFRRLAPWPFLKFPT